MQKLCEFNHLGFHKMARDTKIIVPYSWKMLPCNALQMEPMRIIVNKICYLVHISRLISYHVLWSPSCLTLRAPISCTRQKTITNNILEFINEQGTWIWSELRKGGRGGFGLARQILREKLINVSKRLDQSYGDLLNGTD